MRFTVLTIDKDAFGKETCYKRWEVAGDTLRECFKAAYLSERSLRYCSDRRIEFEDPEVRKSYLDWKRHGVTLEMFYGNATVD